MLEKQDSNKVGLYLAREVDGALPENPVFITREPNSFDSFGGTYAKVRRNPFNTSRQNKKGTTSDLDVAGGWNEDVTQNNLFDFAEGFFFAALRRKALQAVTAIDGETKTFTVGSAAGFTVGSMVALSGMASKINNGMKHITGIAGNVVTVAEELVDEAIAVGAAKMATNVGRRFAAGDCALSKVDNMVLLTFTAADPATFGLIPGEWTFIGGDLAVTQFADVKPGYGRLNRIEGKTMFFDKFTSVVADDADDEGVGKTIELFFGFLVKNEDDEDLIVEHSFVAERPLGKDDDGTQSDNMENMVFNQLTWNSPLANKPTVGITGIGLNYDTRTGAEGLRAREEGAVVVKALGEEAFNTSTNVYRIRLSMIDPVTGVPSPLFARCTEWSIVINNNVSAAKAQGELGGFATTVGQFDVSLTVTAYFNTVAAITSIKNNDDCTFDAIYAKKNAGIIWDLPLISTGGGALTIAQNQPIMLPLTNEAAESPFGHTALLNFMPYLPSVAMARGG
jgi:hypothetical protein